MKTTFDADGQLTIKPETGIETYALRTWFDSWDAGGSAVLYIDYDSKAHNVKQRDVKIEGKEFFLDAHTEHCCLYCGCKYGDLDCPVVSGVKVQSFKCGDTTECYMKKEHSK